MGFRHETPKGFKISSFSIPTTSFSNGKYAIPIRFLIFMHMITKARNKMKTTMLMDRIMITVSLVSVGIIRKHD